MSLKRSLSVWIGVDCAVSLFNGTVALDVALAALSIGSGDDVVVTSRTFIASVSSIVNAGARSIFADVDVESGTLQHAPYPKLLRKTLGQLYVFTLLGGRVIWMRIMESLPNITIC